MSLLIIQPNLASEEAHKWLVDVFVQMLDATDSNYPLTADNFAYVAEHLSYEETDAIFEKAMEGLLK